MANVKFSEIADGNALVPATDQLLAVRSGTSDVLVDAGALAALSTVGTSQIDNDAVTYAKIQNVSATDKVLGRSSSGAGDIEEIPCTAAGRALLNGADASAQRSTLGLVIGTNVQAWSANLDTWSGKTAPSGSVVGTSDTQTLTNKTLTSPAINSPTGLTKSDVGLGNVDNTSDATKNSATATLTNKTISSANNTIQATESLVIAASDETTDITTGTAKVTFRMPYAFTLTAVRASLTAASTSGTPTIDINDNGSTILSTKITIDVNEKTSTTAATPPVISDSALADDAEMTIDVDVAGTGAKGLKVYLIGRQA